MKNVLTNIFLLFGACYDCISTRRGKICILTYSLGDSKQRPKSARALLGESPEKASARLCPLRTLMQENLVFLSVMARKSVLNVIN